MKRTTNFKILLFLMAFFPGLLTVAQEKKTGKTTEVFGKKISAEELSKGHGFVRCGTTEYEDYLRSIDPKRLNDEQFEAWLTPLVEKAKSNRSETGGIITIPVVVHVIHSGQAVGTAPNITASQVISQITVFNQDFRKMAGTPGANSNPVGADVMIQFAMAKVDPNGNPTDGINRVNLCQPSWSTADINTVVKPTTIWDPTKYLNMWSVDFTDNTLLGYAQFPTNSTLVGVPTTPGTTAATDGVVCNYATFGSSDFNDGTFITSAPYDKGRTMTHEVGHWLGLRHIWGDSNCATDYCADTPTHHTANYNCPNVNGCDTPVVPEMVENYMDYTDDTCMNIFTVNQKDRMLTVMANSPRRVELRASTKDIAIPLFPNDAELKLEPNCAAAGGASCSTGSGATQKLTIYNRGTSNLTSATIQYSINGGAAQTYTWNGNLAQNNLDTFNMPVVGGTASGPINIAIVNANGAADQRASNNSVSGTFTLPAAAPDYAFNTVVFRLQKDNYGSETTWNLKNEAGTVLYSGGDYTDQSGGGALITQNWNLTNNGCYTFTIADDFGDGICCSYGNGYFDLKSQDGTTTIFSGSNFGGSANKTFTINKVLGNESFELTKAISLYPNPTSGILNIEMGGLGLPSSYEIYNSIGQKILSKNKVSQADLRISTTEFSNGVYFIKINKDGSSATLRFIKN